MTLTGKSHVIPVVFATNDNYAPYLEVALRSLIEHADDLHEYHIYILYTELSSKYMRAIGSLAERNVRIEFTDVSENLKGVDYLPTGYPSAETLYRIVAAEIFSEQYEKIVYLDCDLIVLRDIALLHAHDLKDSVLGAAKEMLSVALAEYVEQTLGIHSKDYFNAGVLLINTHKFEEFAIRKKCFELLMSGKTLKYADQDALNIACEGLVEFIEKRWNADWAYKRLNMQINPDVRMDDAMNEPNIVHYITDMKPWRRPDLEFSEYFWKYARKSVFYEEILFRNFNENRYNCFARHLFPFNSVKKGKSIILYGAGSVGEAFYRQLQITRYAVLLAWCDKNYKNLKGENLISNPAFIRKLPYDYIVIAVKSKTIADEIRCDLIGMGVDETKIVWTYPEHL